MATHREMEHHLRRIEDAASDALQELSTLVDSSEIECDAGTLADTLRDCHSDAEALLTTEVEDLEYAVRQLVSDLSEACTNAQDIYNRL